MDATKLKVMIVEDHPLLRLGLKIVLEARNVSVVAEAENGEQAVAAAASSKPDVILMDVGMPVMDGIEAARRIREFDQIVKIIMLTSLDNEEHIFASLAAGVNGYCLKETKPDRLITALQSVRNGDLWIDSSIAAKVLRSLPVHADKSESAGDKRANQMSTEELQVLHLIVEGMVVNEIATRLDKSEQQIKEIEKGIMERLASNERTQTALQKVRSGVDRYTSEAVKSCHTCSRTFDDVFMCCPFDGTHLEKIAVDEVTGTVFADRYQIISKLGTGGMSVVYKARHKLLDRVVAIKLLDPLLASDLQNARRFREEALASSLMSHPNLVNIFDFGLSATGEPYLVMDYVDGKTLGDIVVDDGPITVDRAVSIFVQACDGLEQAHSKGVIHRDLKPSNIMLVKDEKTGGETVKIIDFGIAKVLTSPKRSQNLTVKGEVLGSPTHMSPEQCLGQVVDERSDIYSLGCAMYEVLSGHLPLIGRGPFETMQMHIDRKPTSLKELVPERAIPAELDRIVMKALSKNKDDRYQSMSAMKADLSKLLVHHSH